MADTCRHCAQLAPDLGSERGRCGARSIRSVFRSVVVGTMRYRAFTVIVLALCLVALLSACGGGKGGGGY